MQLKAPSNKRGPKLPPIEAGLHVAGCYGIFDIGTQPVSPGRPGKPQRKLVIAWELPHCRADFKRDEEIVNLPRAISSTYTFSMYENARLRKCLQGWLGKKLSDEAADAFDMFSMIGKFCQILVTHREVGDEIYANVDNVVPIPKETPPTALKIENAPQMYSLDEHGLAIPKNVPNWIVKKIHACFEWVALEAQGSHVAMDTEDQPQGPVDDDPPPF
jgi:hypothetical protein